MSTRKWPSYLRTLWGRLLFPLPCLCLALLLTSCASSGVVTKPIPSNGCEWVRPIYVGKADVLTDPTARAILAHDLAWQRVCGMSAKPK